jgi:hypothetical protein
MVRQVRRRFATLAGNIIEHPGGGETGWVQPVLHRRRRSSIVSAILLGYPYAHLSPKGKMHSPADLPKPSYAYSPPAQTTAVTLTPPKRCAATEAALMH